VLQCATHCNTLQHTASCTSVMPVFLERYYDEGIPTYTATHCNTLQHTVTHCNTLGDASVFGTVLWRGHPNLHHPLHQPLGVHGDLYTSVHIYAYVHMYVYICICMYTYVYISGIYIYIYVYMCIQKRTHRDTHMHMH